MISSFIERERTLVASGAASVQPANALARLTSSASSHGKRKAAPE